MTVLTTQLRIHKICKTLARCSQTKKFIFCLTALSSTIFTPLSVLASDFSMKRPVKAPAATPQLIGGTPALLSDWPATFIFEKTGGGGCTSTAVGRNVILTAAHCVPNKGTGEVTVGAEKLTVTCEHHPRYIAHNRTADFALCKTHGTITGMPFERINTSLTTAKIGERVQLLGYGCQTDGGFDEKFGVLFEGMSTVVKTPEPSRNNFDTVTRGGAALCFGDSGGAAYYYTRPDQQGRTVFAVNSRGDISTTSWLSSTHLRGFIDWAYEWADANHGEICGLHPIAENCKRL